MFPRGLGNPGYIPYWGGWTQQRTEANKIKITAVLDRTAPKDLADIWGLCCQMGLSLSEAISGAQGKAAGIFPVDLARVLCSVTRSDWELVRWIKSPDPEQFIEQLAGLGKSLIFPG